MKTWHGKTDEKIMAAGIEILAGPFETKERAWEEEEEKINPEGWAGARTPKVAKGYDDKWYVIVNPQAQAP